jgi:hypothetical protein
MHFSHQVLIDLRGCGFNLPGFTAAHNRGLQRDYQDYPLQATCQPTGR